MIGQQVVLFEVAGAVCALDRAAVRELLPIARLWRPPATPSTVAGILELDGTAIPVLRLRRLLGLGEGDGDAEDIYRHLILVDGVVPEVPVALLVDRVLDVVRPGGPVVPAGHASLNGCVVGELPWSGGLAHLVAADRILMAAEQQGVAELGREAEARLSEWRAGA